MVWFWWWWRLVTYLGGGGRQVLRCGQDRTRGTPPNWWGETLTCALLTTRALTSHVIFTLPSDNAHWMDGLL